MRVLLAGNPASRAGRGARSMQEAARVLREGGADVRVFETTGPGHARRDLAAALRDAERVVACGGDGLVSEVAAALSGGATPLAIVPAGRGNDFARALRVPLEVAAAARLALEGSPRAVDLATGNGATFCTVAACGLDAEVSRRARRMTLPLPGAATYVLALLLQLRDIPGARMRVRVDGALVIDDELMVLAMANTPNYGGGIRIAPDARVDDGLLHACALRKTSRRRALALLAQVMRGRHAAEPEVRMLSGRRIEVVADPPLPLEADGEALGATPAVFECVPGALRVIAG